MKKILVVVDMQNDFITGPLGNEDCQNAVKGCIDLCENGGFDTIFWTQDTHQANYLETFEGKNLPIKHCIDNTPGWEIIPELQPFITDSFHVVTKETFGSVSRSFKDETLSKLIDEWITEHTTKVVDWYEPVEIHFAGVCTSICVLSNMTICRAYFPNTRIVLHRNATGDVTDEMKQAAFVCAKAIQCDVED